MSDKNDRYTHSSGSKSEWPIEKQVNEILGVPSHSHDVKDNATGRTGHGDGRSHQEASRNAWSDLKDKK